ncbi:mitochondrial ribosomal protein S34 [Lasioglossum baleicum]|uniref:mitochondrial ribosomal protein S34 n=1 Tax=Lasioglossum baleicum TaxID=434251 RepID=UPI003FCCA5E5
MGIKYIGRTTTLKGKSLWEILGNLKNFGVGRMVIRSQYQRYPEPCYMRILKVSALPMIGEANPDNVRKVVALVERTFRGETKEKPVQLESVTYKSDYVLIPKDEESRYLNAPGRLPMRVMPSEIEFPPLLKEILIREAIKREGKEYPVVEPKLRLKYNLTGVKGYIVAKQQETPTVDLEATKRPTLYSSNECENRLQ